MNKDLPKVFAVPIEKKLKNNEDVFIGNNKEVRGEVIDKNQINKIFNSKTHVYKTRVIIKTLKEQKEVDVVGLSNDNLLTLNGLAIPINEIIEIKKV